MVETTEQRRPRGGRFLAAALLLLFVAVGTGLRVQATYGDPSFDATDARSLLKSDPGFIHYVAGRIADAGGLPPSDLRADPRVEHPQTSDVPAMFTIGQEFVVAWGHLATGREVPLHVVAVWLMSLFAALTVVGVFGLTYELTDRSTFWASAAAALYLVVPGNYRTVCFILVREDFSIPWLALHLYAFARAVRVRTVPAAALAALLLVMAAGTWHAMGFVLTIELLSVLAWFLWTGQNPLAHRSASIVPVVVVLGGLAIPALLTKGFLFSLPMLLLFGLAIAGALERRTDLSPALVRASAPAAAVALLFVGRGVAAVTGFGRSDLSHVVEFMVAKVRHMGSLPADPTALTFDTRLLWQGPFATPPLGQLLGAFGLGTIVLAVALVRGSESWLRRSGDPRVNVATMFAIGGLLAALLVQRTVIVPALLIPVLGAVLLRAVPSPGTRSTVLYAGLGLQALLFAMWIGGYRSPWYQPLTTGDQIAQTVRWIEENVPDDEPICTDFVTGTAILAHAGNPILVQPKYETTRSRRKIEQLMTTFVSGRLRDLRQFLDENECRYIVTNYDFWRGHAYAAGERIGPGSPPGPRTPFYNLCAGDPRVPRSLPGYALLFESRAEAGNGILRVFRMREIRRR